MVSTKKLDNLRTIITENLRVQRDGQPIEYINVGTALQDACSRQNHAIFARRGCGKTLLLHFSASKMPSHTRPTYLNCEEFKRHSFPNVLIEILSSIFRELHRNLHGWFGRSRSSKKIIQEIIDKLDTLKKSADLHSEDIKTRTVAAATAGGETSLNGGADGLDLKIGVKVGTDQRDEIEKSFKSHRDKLQELDNWLPSLKDNIREFFRISGNVQSIIIQVDDLYHLKRSDQAFVVDYIHRLCKDLPLYFKIATLRHASTLYVDRDGQPVGAQERHDYQPINIDYTFGDFKKTADQNWHILQKFAEQARLSKDELKFLFKGEGFNRLVMAGGGVPRDVLSLFLEILSDVGADEGGRIGKDEVRIISKSNFERKIEELKQDSKGEEQGDLLRGIYIIRQFCLQRKTNIFLVSERELQTNDQWRALFYRLMDYRIIHNCATALTHKSQEGTFQAFAIDIGCYAHLRKLQDRFNEIDVGEMRAKEQMRSAPVLDVPKLGELYRAAPANVERELLEPELDPFA